MSLRVALQMLGLGPCHHMHHVIQNMPEQVPLWVAALEGRPDWEAIYAGQQSAVDWPTASFYRELHAAYPQARFILTHRNPETWVESFSETIFTALAGRAEAPEEVHPWMDMCLGVIARAGFEQGMDASALTAAFHAHNEAVRSAIPAAQLLEYQVKEGWEPLCAFLGVDVPDEDFPRTNDRAQFWELVNGGEV
jgi:hypothetical protein